ncbi:MAG: glutaredoxin family protein [Dehalococcoidia bacterium]|nr:glutaredoxin family protein [Dehalococcoidia bacterium]
MERNVTLYKKSGCHLCEDAAALLLRLQQDLQFDLHTVDITADLATYARYKESIPVVELNGDEVLSAPIGENMARTILTTRLAALGS